MKSTTRFLTTATLVAALALSAFVATGCAKTPVSSTGGANATSATTTYPYTITDDAGRQVTIDAEPRAVVSLAPANTEIVYAIGAGDRMVGVTSYDDYPAEVADLAKVGDFAGPNIEAVAALNPDLVLLTGGVQQEVIDQLEGLGATAVVIDPKTIEGVEKDITVLGAVLNEREGAASVVADMVARLDAVKAEAAKLPKKVSAFIEIGQNPLFTAGTDTMMSEAISLAGGSNIVAESGWVAYSAEQVIAADPLVYMYTSMSGATKDDIDSRPGYSSLTAVKNGDVIEIEDNLISRPGPRIVEGIESMLAAFKAAAAR